MGLAETLTRLARDWATPRPLPKYPLFMFRCIVYPPAGVAPSGPTVPADLEGLWRFAASARLFEDVACGQWGLVLLSPDESIARTARYREQRPREQRSGDRIVGEFVGDADLVVIRCDPSEDDFGSIVVAGPIDRRCDWAPAAPDLETFLSEFERTTGDKFWETLRSAERGQDARVRT